MAIIEIFEQLQKQLSELADDIQQHEIYWLLDVAHLNTTAPLAQAFLDLWYQGDQDGRTTRIYPGLVAATENQLQKAVEINQLKTDLRQLINDIKQQDLSGWKEIQQKLGKRNRQLHESLSSQGIERLHLKQMWRQIPIIDQVPIKISFNWYTSGRSITRVSKQEAYDMLLQLNTEAAHIKMQLAKLASLPESEKLARVQKQAPVLRANLLFENGQRKAMNASLPILFLQQDKQTLPSFIAPSPAPPKERNRQVRSDNRLEDEPFLKSIRVHRYQ